MKNIQGKLQDKRLQDVQDHNTDKEQHSVSLYNKAAIIIASLALALIGIFYFICYINGGDMRSIYEAILPYLMSGILALSIALMGVSLQH